MRIQKIVAAMAITATAVTLSACSSGADVAPNSDAPQFGPACSAIPTSGPGSFQGMAADPVATAANHNSELSTLVSAVQKAGLVDTLNSAQSITVFAPDNGAFSKIPPATLNQVLNDKAALTKILTYHVVGQKITPNDLASGDFKTLEGDSLKTSGSGQDFKVNDIASVICGNVQTANATVYIIDNLMQPPAL